MTISLIYLMQKIADTSEFFACDVARIYHARDGIASTLKLGKWYYYYRPRESWTLIRLVSYLWSRDDAYLPEH